jgi:hypothetical protein
MLFSDEVDEWNDNMHAGMLKKGQHMDFIIRFFLYF